MKASGQGEDEASGQGEKEASGQAVVKASGQGEEEASGQAVEEASGQGEEAWTEPVVYAAEARVAQTGGWSSKNMVITSVPSTQDGGACRIPQRVLCGGRVPPGPAATFHGILRESAAGVTCSVPTGVDVFAFAICA